MSVASFLAVAITVVAGLEVLAFGVRIARERLADRVNRDATEDAHSVRAFAASDPAGFDGDVLYFGWGALSGMTIAVLALAGVLSLWWVIFGCALAAGSSSAFMARAKYGSYARIGSVWRDAVDVVRRGATRPSRR